jgi:hypothetical protein
MKHKVLTAPCINQRIHVTPYAQMYTHTHTHTHAHMCTHSVQAGHLYHQVLVNLMTQKNSLCKLTFKQAVQIQKV